MPAVSQRQHGFMGLVRGVKEGTTPLSKVRDPKRVKAAAKSLSMDQVKDFNRTRSRGLPPVRKARSA